MCAWCLRCCLKFTRSTRSITASESLNAIPWLQEIQLTEARQLRTARAHIVTHLLLLFSSIRLVIGSPSPPIRPLISLSAIYTSLRKAVFPWKDALNQPEGGMVLRSLLSTLLRIVSRRLEHLLRRHHLVQYLQQIGDRSKMATESTRLTSAGTPAILIRRVGQYAWILCVLLFIYLLFMWFSSICDYATCRVRKSFT